MVSEPERWVKDFALAGANMYTFHIEATGILFQLFWWFIHRFATTIDSRDQEGWDEGWHSHQAKNPSRNTVSFWWKCRYAASDDSWWVVHHFVMLEPGFGGQTFMHDCLAKVATLRQKFPGIDIQVDGGLAEENIEQAAKAGANVIVAGTSIFKSKDPAKTISFFRMTVDKLH